MARARGKTTASPLLGGRFLARPVLGSASVLGLRGGKSTNPGRHLMTQAGLKESTSRFG
jgi:hypothetical protein